MAATVLFHICWVFLSSLEAQKKGGTRIMYRPRIHDLKIIFQYFVFFNIFFRKGRAYVLVMNQICYWDTLTE